jgi:hypothetical protein
VLDRPVEHGRRIAFREGNVSIWSSLNLPEPIRDLDGFDVDIAVTGAADEYGEAVRVGFVDGDAGIELSVAHAVRLRDALTRAIVELSPKGESPAAIDWR